LQVEVGQQQPGTTLRVEVLREGKTLTLPVTVEELGGGKHGEERSSNAPGKARWGIGLADLSDDARAQIQAGSDVQGAVIAQVQPGSPADNAGLASGEVIQQINHQTVKSAADAKEALSKIPNGEDVLVLIWANGGSSFRVMHSGDKG
jgi:serine protease Do